MIKVKDLISILQQVPSDTGVVASVEGTCLLDPIDFIQITDSGFLALVSDMDSEYIQEGVSHLFVGEKLWERSSDNVMQCNVQVT